MSEWNAAEYGRGSQLQQAMADQTLASLTFAGDERVLDVGCGDGQITGRIAGLVPRGSVVGVDPSADMIGSAAAHHPSTAFPNLMFELGDASALRFAAEFDRVVSFNALHWVPDQDAALASIARVLKPGGHALIRLVPKGPRKSLESVVEETRLSSRWARWFDGFSDPYLHWTADEYAAAAQRNGFDVVAVHTDDKTWDFGSRDGLTAFCSMGCRAWTVRLPEGERRAFIDDVVDRYGVVTEQPTAAVKVFRFYQMEIRLAVAGA